MNKTYKLCFCPSYSSKRVQRFAKNKVYNCCRYRYVRLLHSSPVFWTAVEVFLVSYFGLGFQFFLNSFPFSFTPLRIQGPLLLKYNDAHLGWRQSFKRKRDISDQGTFSCYQNSSFVACVYIRDALRDKFQLHSFYRWSACCDAFHPSLRFHFGLQ